MGGAVRDELLGLPVKDRDFVVVGATAGEMLERGFKPVGKDFPVFLHPQTHEEYALARTERKTAPGYKGFVFHADPGVSLEDDLRRRDLTINAIAQSADGQLIDPCQGRRDLAARLLRHVSPAFAEDPVRILRLARFAARFEDFSVAPETLALCAEMVAAGEVDALVPERVWQELARGLMSGRPGRMLEVLERCGALARLLPERTPASAHPEALAALAAAVSADCPLAQRWACLWFDPAGHGGTAARRAGERLKVPADCRELAVLAASEASAVAAMAGARGDALMSLFERCDALRRPSRFEDLLGVARCAGAAPAALQACHSGLAAARSIDAGAQARLAPSPGEIAQQVRAARVAAIEAGLQA